MARKLAMLNSNITIQPTSDGRESSEDGCAHIAQRLPVTAARHFEVVLGLIQDGFQFFFLGYRRRNRCL
jgi:hypothetical protein